MVGLGNTQDPLQQLPPMQLILTARQQRWVWGQEEQLHHLTHVSSAVKLVTGHATAPVSAPTGCICLLLTKTVFDSGTL